MNTKHTYSIRAYAKLNLSLAVLGCRPDGFHDIESVVVGIACFDHLTAHRIPAGIEFHCNDHNLSGHDNLVYRAASLVQLRYSCPSGIHLELTKNIPVGAGMGGGSSDAAATLLLCNTVWDLGLSTTALASLGAELGSDIPLFFHLPSSLVRGRGERVDTFPLAWRGWVVLMHTGHFVSTPAVYAQWQPVNGCKDAHERIKLLQCATKSRTMMQYIFNDLEPAVFRVSPEVNACYHQLVATGWVEGLRVTGAGSVMYVLEDDESSAQQLADRLRTLNGLESVVVCRVLDHETLEVTEE